MASPVLVLILRIIVSFVSFEAPVPSKCPPSCSVAFLKLVKKFLYKKCQVLSQMAHVC